MVLRSHICDEIGARSRGCPIRVPFASASKRVFDWLVNTNLHSPMPQFICYLVQLRTYKYNKQIPREGRVWSAGVLPRPHY